MRSAYDRHDPYALMTMMTPSLPPAGASEARRTRLSSRINLVAFATVAKMLLTDVMSRVNLEPPLRADQR